MKILKTLSWLLAPGDSEKKMAKAADSAACAAALETIVLFAAKPGVGAIQHDGGMLDRPFAGGKRDLADAGSLVAAGRADGGNRASGFQ